MKQPFFSFVFLIIGFLFFGCSDEDVSPTSPTSNSPTTTTQNAGWLIPQDQIFDGGPGKDGIPSIDRPGFSNISHRDLDFLPDEALVVAVHFGDEARAYPHPVLDWHEIVNDRIDDISLALTY